MNLITLTIEQKITVLEEAIRMFKANKESNKYLPARNRFKKTLTDVLRLVIQNKFKQQMLSNCSYLIALGLDNEQEDSSEYWWHPLDVDSRINYLQNRLDFLLTIAPKKKLEDDDTLMCFI